MLKFGKTQNHKTTFEINHKGLAPEQLRITKSIISELVKMMETNQENILFSPRNHDSTLQPFFLPNIDNNTNISIIEDNNLLLAIEFKELNLEKSIADFYLDNEAFNVFY